MPAGGPCDRLLDRKSSVLLLIDMQEKLLPVMHESAEVLRNTIKLARFASIVNLPVLVTEQEKLGPTVEELRSALPGFEPVSKIEFDACLRPEFNEALERFSRGTVIVSGIESHICVTQTSLHLLERYNVHVVADAVSSREPANRRVALDRMARAGVTVSSTEMVIFELLERAGTDEFRKVLELIK
jgi:nicotinamidase-related amidase